MKQIVQTTANSRAGPTRAVDLKLERRHAWSKATNLNCEVDVKHKMARASERNSLRPRRLMFQNFSKRLDAGDEERREVLT